MRRAAVALTAAGILALGGACADDDGGEVREIESDDGGSPTGTGTGTGAGTGTGTEAETTTTGSETGTETE